MVKIHRAWLIGLFTVLLGAIATFIFARGEQIGAKATVNYVDKQDQAIIELYNSLKEDNNKEHEEIKEDQKDYVTSKEFEAFFLLVQDMDKDISYIRGRVDEIGK